MTLAPGSDVIGHERVQRDGRRIGQRPHPAPAEPRRFPDLHRDAGEHLLAPGPAAAQPRLLTADERLVHFHQPGQPVPPRAYQHRPQPMQHSPRDVRERFGPISDGVARGLRLRHDHGSNYLADDFQQEVAFFGIESSPSFVREPEGNGVAERFIRTLKENLLWVRSFETIEELRLALLEFQADVQRAVDAGEVRLSESSPSATRFRRAGRGSVEVITFKLLSKNPGALQP